MFRLTPYVIKSLWRNRARTALTVSGSAVALFVFCFVGAVQQGLEEVTRDRDNTLIVFQENRFCPTSSRLPGDYARIIAEVDGVRDVVPIQVYTNNCRASLDAIVFNGVSPEKLRRARDLRLETGAWSDFAARRDAAFIGRRAALRRGLAVGDTFTLGAVTVQIAGVFASSRADEENLIYTHLEFLQQTRTLDSVGLVTLHEVHLADSADPEEAAARIDQQLRAGPVATTTRRKGAFQASTLSDLVGLIRFSHWLGFACIGLVLSIVATTTLMAVQDRTQEHAVLQTLGLRPWGVFRLVLAESILLSGLGGVAGTVAALGVLAATGLAVGAEGVTVAFTPSLELALIGIMVSVVTGVLAGLAPGWQASRADLVTALTGR